MTSLFILKHLSSYFRYVHLFTVYQVKLFHCSLFHQSLEKNGSYYSHLMRAILLKKASSNLKRGLKIFWLQKHYLKSLHHICLHLICAYFITVINGVGTKRIHKEARDYSSWMQHRIPYLCTKFLDTILNLLSQW